MDRTLSRRMATVWVVAILASLLIPAESAVAGPPGENGPLVYVENGDLFRIQPDGAEDVLVADGNFSRPDVSPDGTRALVADLDSSTATGPLYSIDLVTGARTTVVVSGVTSAAWSGDGSAIAYAADGVYVLEGGDSARLLSADVTTVWDWSPVDDRILVSRGGGEEPSGHSLETVDAGTGTRIVIAADADSTTWRVTGADFAPDGTDIVYSTAQDDDYRTLVLASDPSNPIDATGEPPPSSGPRGDATWSPDGSSIAYGHRDFRGAHTVKVLPLESRERVTVEATGWALDWAPVPTSETAGFVDVPVDDIFHRDILWLADQGITRGCNPPANDRFCPDEFVTRGQMAAFLVRAFGYDHPDQGDLFVDDDGSVFELDIDRLAGAGVTKGCNPPTNDRFCPDEFVTRGQMAAFLVRAFGYDLPDPGDLFVDDDGSVFETDIDRLGAAGITRGCNPPVNDRFCPEEFVTRGQMAAFLHRAFGG